MGWEMQKSCQPRDQCAYHKQELGWSFLDWEGFLISVGETGQDPPLAPWVPEALVPFLYSPRDPAGDPLKRC